VGLLGATSQAQHHHQDTMGPNPGFSPILWLPLLACSLIAMFMAENSFISPIPDSTALLIFLCFTSHHSSSYYCYSIIIPFFQLYVLIKHLLFLLFIYFFYYYLCLSIIISVQFEREFRYFILVPFFVYNNTDPYSSKNFFF